MKTEASSPRSSQGHEVGIAGEPLNVSIGRRARLMGASALAGGALRSLVAAGMATVFGASPAMAQCFSGTPAS